MKTFYTGFERGDKVFCCATGSAFYKEEFTIFDFDLKNKKILLVSGEGTIPLSFRREEIKRKVIDARENSKQTTWNSQTKSTQD